MTDERRDATIHWAEFRSLLGTDDASRSRGRTLGIATTVAIGLWVAALVCVFLTWNGAAEHADVSLQLPYLVSGGLTALLLTVIGAAVLLWGVLAEAGEVVEGADQRAPQSFDGAGDVVSVRSSPR